MSKTNLIRTIYLYLFSLVGLVLVIIAGVRFIDMGLKAWVFTQADNYQYSYDVAPRVVDENGNVTKEEISKEDQQKQQAERIVQQRQRDASNSLAMLAIGLPLYLFHWRMATKKREEE